MNVEKPEIIIILKQTTPIHITLEQKQPQNVEYFKKLGSVITNDARCTH
jgi:hypothetical protein